MRAIAFFVLVLTSFLLAQTATLTVHTNDSYTNRAIDSVQVYLYQNNVLQDSALTDTSGTARFTIHLTGISEMNQPLPTSFALSPGYPNPFADQTAVDVAVPKAGALSFRLYNLLGQKVLSGKIDLQAGTYRLNMSGLSALASGIYLLQMGNAGQSAAVKLLKLSNGPQAGSVRPKLKLTRSDHSFKAQPNRLPKLSGENTFNLRFKKTSYEEVNITLTLSGDRELSVPLQRLNRCAFWVHDSTGKSVPMLLKLFNQTDSLILTAPDTVTLLSGWYTLIGQSDSVSGLNSRIEVPSVDSTYRFVVQNLMRDVSVTLIDTTEGNQAIGNKTLEISSAEKQYALVLDDSGKGYLRLKTGDWRFAFAGDSLYASFERMIHIQRDTTLVLGTQSSKPLVFTVKYPDSAAVADARIDINGQTLITDANGQARTRKFNGQYTYTIYDDEGRIVCTERVVQVQGATSIEDVVEEYLNLGDFHFTAKEDSAVILDLRQIQYGTAEDTSYVIMTDPNASVEYLGGHLFKITPNSDFNGQITFRVYARAEHGTEKTEQFTGTFEPMTDFGGWIVDNESRLPVPGNVTLFLSNGQTKELHTDSTGYFKTQLEPQQNLDSLLVWHIDGDSINSFGVKYPDIPLDQDLTNAGLFITTYDSIIYGHNVADSLAVTPHLFRDYIEEGNWSGAPLGIKTIDFQHVQNPVPNPNGPHGYVYWIDSDYYANKYPQYFRQLTPEEQNYIKSVIEREVLPKIKEENHKIPIYIAQPGEIPPLHPDGDVADGILIIYGNIGSNYDFGGDDRDGDGIIDVAYIGMADPVIGKDIDITEETASIINPNPIYNSELTGKTKFSELGASYHLTPIDIKQLRIEENIWNSTQTVILPYTLPNGIEVMRFYYPRKAHIDNILRLPNQ